MRESGPKHVTDQAAPVDRLGMNHLIWYGQRMVHAIVAISVGVIFCCRASAQLATRTIHVGETSAKSQVPPVAAQGRFLAPQAVSAIDISPDGQLVTVGTTAFSHDANVWSAGGQNQSIVGEPASSLKMSALDAKRLRPLKSQRLLMMR